MVLSRGRLSGADGWRHEGEKLMKQYCADECQSYSESIATPHTNMLALTIDVAKVQLSGKLDLISFRVLST
jgi:hypothetical protein